MTREPDISHCLFSHEC